MPLVRLARLLFWFGLIAWTCAVTSAAIAAAHTFPTLKTMPMTLDAFAAYQGVEEHGLIAAGHVLQEVFQTTDHLQLIAAGMTLVGVLLELLSRRTAGGTLRILFVLAAAGLLGWYYVMVRPDMQTLLETKWNAAKAGDLVVAAQATEDFDPLHHLARRLHSIILLMLLCAAGLAAVSLPGLGRGQKSE